MGIRKLHGRTTVIVIIRLKKEKKKEEKINYLRFIYNNKVTIFCIKVH